MRLPNPFDPIFNDVSDYVEKLYKPKLPDPTPDPTIEVQISNMVNEGGREPTLPDTVREALESFE